MYSTHLLAVQLYKIINLKQKSSSNPTSLIYKKTILTDQKEIADHFNSYFSGIAENILKNRKYEGKHSYQEYLKNPLPNSHVFFDCDPSEVECLISALEISKKSGPYSIPVNILRAGRKQGVKPWLTTTLAISGQWQWHVKTAADSEF